MFLFSILLGAPANIDPNNKKLTGFYTVEAPTNFASNDIRPCHIVRVVNGEILIYQTDQMHPLLRILRFHIRGVNIDAIRNKQVTILIKHLLLKGKRILWLNPKWCEGLGAIEVDVYVDGQSLAVVLQEYLKQD